MIRVMSDFVLNLLYGWLHVHECIFKGKSPKAKAIKELTKAKKSPKKKVAAAATKKSPKKALKKAEKATGKGTTKPKVLTADYFRLIL